MMNKKAVFFPILIILGVIALFYLVIVWNPFHAFDSIKSTMNYFLFLLIFLILQAGIIFGYYELGKYVTKGFRWYHFKIQRITQNVHQKLQMSQLR